MSDAITPKKCLDKRRVEVLEGWLLHKRPLRETSLQVFFLTREYGLVNASYRGGRAPKKHNFLQAFTPLSLSIDVVSDRFYIRNIELSLAPLPLQSVSLFAGLYLNELLFYALAPFDPAPGLFDVYVETVESLQKENADLQAIEKILRRFEWAVLTACGQKMSFTQVAYSDEHIETERTYHFIANAGFVPDSDGIFLGKDILALSQGDFEDPTRLKHAKFIARQAIDALLEGKVLHTRQLFIR